MIALLAKLALRAGVPARAVRPIAWAGLVLVIVAAAWAAITVIYRTGSDAGGATVRADVAQQGRQRVQEARQDERTASASTAAIATRIARVDAKSDALVRQTIEDLRNALDAVPPAVPGSALPPAPVDRMRDHLNAGIARANRAAAPAAPQP